MFKFFILFILIYIFRKFFIIIFYYSSSIPYSDNKPILYSFKKLSNLVISKLTFYLFIFIKTKVFRNPCNYKHINIKNEYSTSNKL